MPGEVDIAWLAARTFILLVDDMLCYKSRVIQSRGGTVSSGEDPAASGMLWATIGSLDEWNIKNPVLAFPCIVLLLPLPSIVGKLRRSKYGSIAIKILLESITCHTKE